MAVDKFFLFSHSTNSSFLRYILKQIALEVESIRQILKKYLLGNTQAAETETVDKWFQSFDEEAPLHLSDQERETARQEIWEKIAPAIVVERKRRVIPLWIKVAASAAVIAGVAIMLWWTGRPAMDAVMAYTTVTTGNGEKKTITVKDGTQLTLNAGTTLHIYNDFSTTRKVDLVDGEVFFEVHKDPQRPFQIQSSGLTITVLGTSFNVLSYKELSKTTVGVMTGKVRVAKDTTTLGVLQKAEGLVYNKQLHTYKIIPIQDGVPAWKEGRLVLDDVSFREMAFLMKKNFGTDMLTSDTQVLNTRYTTELPTSMTGEQAAEVLAAVHNLKTKKQNDQVIFYK